MNDTPRISLSAAQRSALRVALKNSPGWLDYRKTHSCDISGMSVTELLAAADALGVHSRDYMDAIATSEAPFNMPIVEAPSPVIDDRRPSTRAVEEQIRRAREEADSMIEALDKVKTLPPVPAPVADTSAATQLASLIGKLAGESMSPDAIRAVVDAQIDARLKASPVVRIEVVGSDKVTREVSGHSHPQLKKLLVAAASRMANGYAPNVWISGPAGSGKTHAGHQVADALGVQFTFNGAISQEFQLLGFVDANGTYHRTAFREVYENGGVYMFDEVDGSDNSALLALNAALANGQATFPDATIKRHKDSIIFASANTWGLGATADYVGRAKLDAAFLSRFPVRLFWDYDVALELNIAGNAKFAQRVIDARARARSAGLKVLIDPRASQAGSALIASGMTSDEAAELTYLANLTQEQRKMVEGH